MSEIKVNKISPKQTCTQLTLGDSGDTIIIPAGATITNNGTATGFGPTGAVSWDTTPKTTTVTAVNGVGYFINTTSGGVTVNLPAGSAGAIVALADYAATWNTNNVTVNANGTEKIGGVASAPAILNTQGQSVTFIYVDSTEGWINVGDATAVAGNNFVAATGGTILTCGDYKTHIFTGPGTFTVTNAGQPTGSNSVEYLVVAGGGGGGYDFGAGGGAGGFRTYTALPSASPLNGPASLPVSAQGYPITVGAGGAGGVETPASNSVSGSPSIFSTITSTGGGRGGAAGGNSIGSSGGSGGGNRFGSQSAGGAGNTPPTSPPQGNSGGPTAAAGNPPYWASGGGGAGAAGEGKSIPDGTVGGYGGDGSFIPTGFIGPTSPSYGETGPAGRYFAGGGAGGGYSAGGGIGGLGGGGGCGPTSPAPAPAPSGIVNTGGGGQGAPNCGQPRNAGSGGSGIVIIRYKFQ
jgi:hypothetical protein